MTKWTNDYGDVPRWYWSATCFLPPPRRLANRIGRTLLASVIALTGGWR